MGISALRASTAAAVLCLAAPAWAVTPAEVWQSWQDLSQSYGQTLTTGAVDDAGDTLTVTDMVLTQDQDGVKTEVTISELVFTDNGDGSVDIAMPADVPMTVTTPPAAGATEPTTVTILMSQPDLSLTASGEADAVSYEMAGPEATIKLDSIDGPDADKVDLVAEVKLTDLEGGYTVETVDDTSSLSYEMNATSMNMTVTGKGLPVAEGADAATSGPTDLNLVLGMADLAVSGEGSILSPAVMENFGKALAEGMSSSGEMSAGATSVTMDVTEAGKTTNLVGTGASSSFQFGIGPDGLRYGGGGKDVSMSVKGTDIPFPELKVTYAEAAVDLLIPLLKGAEPQDFVFLTRLVDFTVSDEVWAMFDPAGQLPRDPATLVFDAKGKATVTADIADTATMESMETAPGELNALDLTEIRAKFAGAELTGTGNFTFDNTDLVTFQGVPAPTGKLDLKLTGGNGLMDKLVAMGMLSEDDVMGFRMMLSMFANTAADKDEMTSTLEFKDKGFYANGQRLQ